MPSFWSRRSRNVHPLNFRPSVGTTRKRRRLLLESLEHRRVLATYFVNSTIDDAGGICVADNPVGNDSCTLRAAIGLSESTAEADTIQIAPGTYPVQMLNGPFAIGFGGDLTLRGDPNAIDPVIIDGANEVQLFNHSSGQPDTLRFENLTLQNGRAVGSNGGGAIGAADPITLIIDNVSFLGNDAIADLIFGGNSSGGAIDIDGDLTISNSLFRNNSAAGNGGAIAFFIEPGAGITGPLSTMTIANTIFESNRAGTDGNDFSEGGAIWTAGSDSRVNISDSTFTTNISGESGGALYADQASIVISSTTFSGNRATGTDSGGGAVYLIGDPNSAAPTTFAITDGSFTSNLSVSGGGGIEAAEATGTITGTTFRSNQVTGIGTELDQGGGAMVLLSLNSTPDVIQLDNVNISENSAPSGGGVAAINVALTVMNSSISENTTNLSAVEVGAGGIGMVSALAGASLVIENSQINGNISAGEAGGVGVLDTNVFITGTTIDGNRAVSGRGGGIGIARLNATTDRILSLNSTTISNNVSTGDGGGIAAIDFVISMTNTTVSGNRSISGFGGGLGYQNLSPPASPSSIQFTTFANNFAPSVGSNFAASGESIQIGSSIFAGSGAIFAPGYIPVSLGSNIDSGTTFGFNQPTDLSSTNPLIGALQDNGGPVFTHALLAGSPAIDTANAGLTTVDARGVLRPLDGDGDTIARADSGAFEAAAIVRAAISIENVSVNEGNTATLTLRLTGAVAGGFTVTAATQDGSATAGLDYTALSTNVAFVGTDGETQTLTVSTIDDVLVESSELFTLALSNASSSLVTITDTATVTIVDNDIVATATADVNISAAVQAGDFIIAGQAFTYEVRVSNIGPDSAQQVTMTAPIPSGTSFVSFDPVGTSSTFAVSSGVLSVIVGTLNSDQAVTFRYDVLVNANATGPITNNTSVTSTTSDPVLTNNSSMVNSLIQTPGLLTGHVFCDANNSDSEESGEALPGVRVFADGNGNRRFDANELETTTDSLGDYRFTTLPQGSYVLVAEIPSSCNAIPSNPGVIQSLADVGNLARSIRAIDLDADGDSDLVIASDLDGSLQTLINQSGDLIAGSTIPLGPRLQKIAVSKPDVNPSMMAVVGIGNGGTDAGRVYFGTGDFASAETGNGPIDVLVDDFVPGGGVEIVTASFRNSKLQLFSPDGSFSTREIETTTSNLYAIASGDVDGDGDVDIVAGGYGYDPDQSSGSTATEDSEINILINDGDGNFSRASNDSSLRGKFVAIRVLDLDDDGQAEIIAISEASSSLNTYRFTGGVTSLITSLAIPSKASAMDFGDLDRDGVNDVVVASEAENRVVFYLGSSDGSFRQIQSVDNIPSPTALTFVDLEGDGRSEVAVANLYRRQVNPGNSSPLLPSTVTLLRLQVAQQGVLIEQDPVTANFPIGSAALTARMDVNADTIITAGDALQVINEISRRTSLSSVRAAEGESVSRLWRATDVNLDGDTTALDALLIINELSRMHVRLQTAQAEWQSPAMSDDDLSSAQEQTVDEVITRGLF